MRGTTSIILTLLACGCAATIATAVSPPVAPPTPCPCAADGVCRPKRETWGNYATRWRRWPGDTRPEIPGRPDADIEGQLPDELAPIEAPRPEDEEARAPITERDRERREAAAAAREAAGDDGTGQVPLPEAPIAPPGPAAPGGLLPGFPGPAPLGQPPAEGGLNQQPEQGFPFGQPPAQGPAEQPEQQFLLPKLQSPGLGPNDNLDLPPALPSGISWQSQPVETNVVRADAPPAPQHEKPVVRLPFFAPRGEAPAGAITPAAALKSTGKASSRVRRTLFARPTGRQDR